MPLYIIHCEDCDIEVNTIENKCDLIRSEKNKVFLGDGEIKLVNKSSKAVGGD